MIVFSMILGFVMMIVGGYGFASTKIASLNIPLMDKIDYTVHSWAFVHPILCGLALVSFAIVNSVSTGKRSYIQRELVAMLALFIIDSYPLYQLISGLVQLHPVPLETALRAETAIAAAVFCIVAFRHLRVTAVAGSVNAITNNAVVSTAHLHSDNISHD